MAEVWSNLNSGYNYCIEICAYLLNDCFACQEPIGVTSVSRLVYTRCNSMHSIITMNRTRHKWLISLPDSKMLKSSINKLFQQQNMLLSEIFITFNHNRILTTADSFFNLVFYLLGNCIFFPCNDVIPKHLIMYHLVLHWIGSGMRKQLQYFSFHVSVGLLRPWGGFFQASMYTIQISCDVILCHI